MLPAGQPTERIQSVCRPVPRPKLAGGQVLHELSRLSRGPYRTLQSRTIFGKGNWQASMRSSLCRTRLQLLRPPLPSLRIAPSEGRLR